METTVYLALASILAVSRAKQAAEDRGVAGAEEPFYPGSRGESDQSVRGGGTEERADGAVAGEEQNRNCFAGGVRRLADAA